MDKQLNDKLMKILYETGKKNAIDEKAWDEFYNNFKAQDRFQLLYTIIDLNSLAKNKKGCRQVKKILAYEKVQNTAIDYKTIEDGFDLLKNSVNFKEYKKNLEESKSRAK